MLKRILYISLFLLLVACLDTDVRHEPQKEYFLQMHVSTGKMRSYGNAGSVENASPDEKRIHSVYVYAFDDNYPVSLSDYYADERVNDAQGKLGQYSFKMKIYDSGSKRFYIFVNPPPYVRSELVANCPEDRLKTLKIYQNEPSFSVNDLQQVIGDEVIADASKGFPMSNCFSADLKVSPSNPLQVLLYPSVPDVFQPINVIPLFRSLGKISIEAKLDDGALPVAINGISIFNYTGDGALLPVWQGENYWVARDRVAVWNTDLKMNFEEMVFNETLAISDLFPLLEQPVLLNKGDTFQSLVSCYLCQNSYGKQQNADVGLQNGLEDLVGNRITQLRISLSDGRESEIRLPFLCRNDHLKVKFIISPNVVNVHFEKWKELEVHPDWNEEVLGKSVTIETAFIKK